MAVGNQPSQAQINQQLSTYAVELRNIMQTIANFEMSVTALGVAGLTGLGFGSADAQAVVTQVNYMSNVAGCYFGTVQQGGSGGTGAILFNFHSELCPLWAGQ
jgi:hypothetical protein